jgi:hypothetical protein
MICEHGIAVIQFPRVRGGLTAIFDDPKGLEREGETSYDREAKTIGV